MKEKPKKSRVRASSKSRESNTPKSLSDCTFDESCRFRMDHFDYGDFSVMTDSHVVWLTEQKSGEIGKQHIEIPRGIFNRLVHQYLRERKFVRVK